MVVAPYQWLTARCPAAGLPKRGPPLLAQSSGLVGGLRLTHSIVRCVGRRGLYLFVDHVGDMQLGMLELVRKLLSLDAIAILW